MRAAIFVVDDQIDVANATARYLRSRGHEVTIETDGEKALAILLGPAEFDVTFLDLLMPGGRNGSDIYNICKRQAKARIKRIVFYTGLDYMVPDWIRTEGVLVITKGGADALNRLVRTVEQFSELDSPRGPHEKAMPPKHPYREPGSKLEPDLASFLDDDIEVDTGMIELAQKRGASREIMTELRIKHLHSSHGDLRNDLEGVKKDVGDVKADVGTVKTDVNTLKTEITTTIKTSTKWLGVIVVGCGLAAWILEHFVMKK